MIMKSPAFRSFRRGYGIDENDPSLVFFAPLYDAGLQGSPFLSRDLNKHSCTVTGATWGPQGRICTGGDDYIDCGSSSLLKITSQDFTFILWAKPTADTFYELMGAGTDNIGGVRFLIHVK
jgi:hypothetical protein